MEAAGIAPAAPIHKADLTVARLCLNHRRVLRRKQEASFFVVVMGIKTSDHPAFALDDGQSHDNREPADFLLPGLFQPRTTLRLIVLVPYQQHASEIGKRVSKIEDRSTRGSRIRLGRLPVKVPVRVDSHIKSRSLDLLPSQCHASRFPNPGTSVVSTAFDREVSLTAARIEPVAVPVAYEDLFRCAGHGKGRVVQSVKHTGLAAAVGPDKDGQGLEVDFDVAQILEVPS
jgi:hypothetical protein